MKARASRARTAALGLSPRALAERLDRGRTHLKRSKAYDKREIDRAVTVSVNGGGDVASRGRIARAGVPRGREAVAVTRGPGIAALLAVAALLAGACNGSGEPSASNTTTTSTRAPARASTTSTISTTDASDDSSDEEQVTQAYLRFWDVRLDANGEPPDPDHPELASVATGEQLENVIAETRRRLDQGLSLRTPESTVMSHDVTVVRISDSEAELQDCFVNDGIVYRIASGEVVDDEVVTRNVSGRMEYLDGQWKLARATVIQEWEGVAGCAVASQ